MIKIDYKSLSLTRFNAQSKGIIVPIVDDVFGDIGTKIPERLYLEFSALVHRALNSSYMSDYKSGLVLFGFGTDDLYPDVLAHEFNSVPFGTLRSRHYGDFGFVTNGPTIVPFANRDVMDILIQGVSTHLMEFFAEAIGAAAEEIVERVLRDNMTLSSDEQKVAKRLSSKAVSKIIEKYSEQIPKYTQYKYVHKMVSAVENMPKEELATLAEALVEVTAHKSRHPMRWKR